MKYNIIAKRRPGIHCVTVAIFKKQQDLNEAILRNKRVVIDVDNYTKTTIKVNVSSDDCSFRCSYIPAGCEDLKFHTTNGYNMWSNTQYEANYFKILKNQKWEAFKRYGIALIDSLHLNTEETITIEFILSKEAIEKLQIPENEICN